MSAQYARRLTGCRGLALALAGLSALIGLAWLEEPATAQIMFGIGPGGGGIGVGIPGIGPGPGPMPREYPPAAPNSEYGSRKDKSSKNSDDGGTRVKDAARSRSGDDSSSHGTGGDASRKAKTSKNGTGDGRDEATKARVGDDSNSHATSVDDSRKVKSSKNGGAGESRIDEATKARPGDDSTSHGASVDETSLFTR
jgi:hypothetical protein